MKTDARKRGHRALSTRCVPHRLDQALATPNLGPSCDDRFRKSNSTVNIRSTALAKGMGCWTWPRTRARKPPEKSGVGEEGDL